MDHAILGFESMNMPAPVHAFFYHIIGSSIATCFHQLYTYIAIVSESTDNREGSCSLVFDSNQTRTKRGAIEQVNQTAKSIFEQPLLIYHLYPPENLGGILFCYWQ